MAIGTPKAVFWIEVLNWEKWNPRKDVKKPSWFRMENDLLDGNPDFDDFICEELVTWWWILSQCSRAQRGTIKCSLEKWERIRGIPVAKAWGAVEKLIEMGTVRVTDTSRPRDVGDTDAEQTRDVGVENASLSRTATNERTNVRDEHGDPNPKNKKTLNPTLAVTKGETLSVVDKSDESLENFEAIKIIDAVIEKGSIATALSLIGKLPDRDRQRYRDFRERYGGAGAAVKGGSP